ncbi:hypothetical protein BPO_1637 [Bergeyella porcorum]|uniref:Co-chaperone DjlA N-terminal domain-containing protein n=1 Tax=Bergeyella porcorum TaxID=1735111 RepID=A0AAU0F2X9_9FLAO
MDIKTDVLSKFIAAAIWADGDYSEVEKDFLKEIATDLKLEDLEEKTSTEIEKIESINEEELASYIETAAKEVKEDQRELILYICLQFLCIDDVLSADEIFNYYEFAELLNINEEKANDILDEFVEENEELVIEED